MKTIRSRCAGAPVSLLLLLALLAFSSAVGAAPRTLVATPSVHFSAPASLWVRGSEGPGPGQFKGPVGIAVASGKVYVAGRGNDRLQVFTTNGDYVEQIGRAGSADGEFASIARVTVGSNGCLYVSEECGRVQKFSPDGGVLRWGGSGAGDGQFTGACGIVVDPASGLVYVVDTGNCRVQLFDQDGVFQSKWGAPGSGPHEFTSPTGISRAKVDKMFKDFVFEELREEEKDDVTTMGEPKHWHEFHIVARKRK